MKIKSSIIVISSLIVMLLVTTFGAVSFKNQKEAEIAAEIQRQKEEEEAIRAAEQAKQATIAAFTGTVNNKANAPEEVVNAINQYLTSYYTSICFLELQDNSDLFSNDYYAQCNYYANKLMVDSRLQYDFDFTMSKAHYDYVITNYWREGDLYCVEISEDDYFSFNFLDPIESSCYDIISDIKFDSNYKISYLYKEQGYYMMFDDNASEISDLSSLYNTYFNEIKNIIEEETLMKQEALTNSYVSTKTYNSSYDRSAAVAYANKYYNTRNTAWFDYDDTGGNCQNYASQCLYAGGIPMDYDGDYQWKQFGYDEYVDINTDNVAKGRTASWIQVLYFNSYARNNTGYGLVAEELENLYYAEPGDIIQVGYKDSENMSHTTIVSQVVNQHILVDSNSLDMKDFPIEAYTYPYRLCVKILGYNS